MAFCQGLAFDLCVSGFASQNLLRLRRNALVFRLRQPLAPSALITRAPRSLFISRRPRLTESLTTYYLNHCKRGTTGNYFSNEKHAVTAFKNTHPPHTHTQLALYFWWLMLFLCWISIHNVGQKVEKVNTALPSNPRYKVSEVHVCLPVLNSSWT